MYRHLKVTFRELGNGRPQSLISSVDIVTIEMELTAKIVDEELLGLTFNSSKVGQRVLSHSRSVKVDHYR